MIEIFSSIFLNIGCLENNITNYNKFIFYNIVNNLIHCITFKLIYSIILGA